MLRKVNEVSKFDVIVTVFINENWGTKAFGP
jgi:hypothetical protein